MKDLAVCTDPGYTPAVLPSRFHRFARRYVQDERDLPFVYLLLQISLTMLPLAVLLFVPAVVGTAWWMAAGLYFFLGTFYFKGPLGLMMHCITHRPLFKKTHGWLNKYTPWVVGPLFGLTPETYFTHHMGMHHPENNMPDDESSTMFYQRDSALSFLRYWADFLVMGLPRLGAYLRRTRKRTLHRQLLRGEVAYVVAVVALAFVNLPATLAVFVVPVLVTRSVMMLGNWSQHAFIDANTPDNCYTNSVTCINTAYNHKCWNDGYHISHHLRPALHWTDHPANFRQNVDKYAANDAIVFDGIHYLHIFAFLMLKRYDLLAKNFVNLGGRYGSDADVVALLRARSRRFARPVLVVA
ncbi:fatty acid desaturase family protein [Hymenobacter nivis]|uniref:Fatty acid desaturase n=1 Tax=Hymenobacter nivis TaxID=1850093 RepID=A0A2Z3GPY8_9BACT|nr:fatty acid desaturase [Hymenobacter nivis]AWM33356.1 fatty acid desaturase [Hymenobacter nivis]